MLESDPEIENLPLTYLLIYKKIFVLGFANQNWGFFTHKCTPSEIKFVNKNFVRSAQYWKFAINVFTKI